MLVNFCHGFPGPSVKFRQRRQRVKSSRISGPLGDPDAPQATRPRRTMRICDFRPSPGAGSAGCCRRAARKGAFPSWATLPMMGCSVKSRRPGGPYVKFRQNRSKHGPRPGPLSNNSQTVKTRTPSGPSVKSRQPPSKHGPRSGPYYPPPAGAAACYSTFMIDILVQHPECEL